MPSVGWLAGALLVGVVMLARRPHRATDRLHRVLEDTTSAAPSAPPASGAGLSDRWVRGASALAGVGLVVLFPSWTSLVVALLIGGLGPFLLNRFEPGSVRRRRERAERDLPLALDLLAACLSSGASFAASARMVALALDGPLALELRTVAVHLELGADPAVVWPTLGPGERMNRVGVAIARACESGAASASSLSRMADDQRARVRREGEAAARRVAVRVAAPLGLCFLPAFVLLAIVPAVLGALTPLVAP